MNHFERAGGPQRRFADDAEEPRRFDDEKGPQPLAAAKRRIAHRLEKSRRTNDLARQRRRREQRVERGFGRLGVGVETAAKLLGAGGCIHEATLLQSSDNGC